MSAPRTPATQVLLRNVFLTAVIEPPRVDRATFQATFMDFDEQGGVGTLIFWRNKAVQEA